jgi:hypothetical protein
MDVLFQPTVVSAPRSAPIHVNTSPPENQQYILYISDLIRHLYDQVSIQLADSPMVADYCMGVLLQARESFQSGNYALAEFYAESVDVKLKRSAQSAKASRGVGIWFLWLWELGLLGFGGFLVGVTFIPNLTLFGVPVSFELLVLMRAAGWGCVGGFVSAIYTMLWFVQFREYDAAYAMNYFARPLQGLLIGALLFLVSQTFFTLTAGNNPQGGAPIGPVPLYVIAAFAGFGQQYIWEFFDNLLRALFRSPQPSGRLKPPIPPM